MHSELYFEFPYDTAQIQKRQKVVTNNGYKGVVLIQNPHSTALE